MTMLADLQYGQAIVGKTVSSIEICNDEVLIVFTDSTEIVMTLSQTGGDYGTPTIETIISQQP